MYAQSVDRRALAILQRFEARADAIADEIAMGTAAEVPALDRATTRCSTPRFVDSPDATWMPFSSLQGPERRQTRRFSPMPASVPRDARVNWCRSHLSCTRTRSRSG
jgi:hypothetical protein